MGAEDMVMAIGKGKKEKMKRNKERLKQDLIVDSSNADREDVLGIRNVDEEDTRKRNKMEKKMKKVEERDSEDGGLERKKVNGKGHGLRQDGEGKVIDKFSRKKKKIGKGFRNEGICVEEERVETESDRHLDENRLEDDDSKDEKEGEVLMDNVVAEKAERKKRKREKKRGKRGDDDASKDSAVDKAVVGEKDGCMGVEMSGDGCNAEVIGKAEKRKRKREKNTGEDDAREDHNQVVNENEDSKGVEISGEGCNAKVIEKVEKNKRKREKEKNKNDLKGVEITGEDMEKSAKKKRRREEVKYKNDLKGVKATGVDEVERKERKRGKGKNKDDLDDNLIPAQGIKGSTLNETKFGDTNNNSISKVKKLQVAENGSDYSKAKKCKKRVSFSGQVEVFPLPDDSNSQKKKDEEGKLVQGKRFTPEEDVIIKDAVYKYIEEHCLGEEGLNMVLNCSAHREVKDCWKYIAECIPYRPRSAIYYRAQVLFRRGEKRKWTEEDYEMIRKFQEEHGNQWKVLAEEFGKHRFHVKDTWRRIRLLNRKRGHWSQEEYQTLFDLVNTDLQLKVSEEKRSKHGMLRDNIHWSAICDKLSTRAEASCCLKWYQQLTSPMVADGLWSDSDDYRLINELYCLDPNCIEDVDWDNIMDHRSGDLCRRRWNQMVLHIGEHGSKSFSEQVEVLARRYCPHLLEVREAWDSKSVVD